MSRVSWKREDDSYKGDLDEFIKLVERDTNYVAY